MKYIIWIFLLLNILLFAQSDDGSKLYQTFGQKKAYQLLVDLANKGDAWAMYALGVSYITQEV